MTKWKEVLNVEKKRFNTNIREDKLIALKRLAELENMGANDMIEKLVDEYIEKNNKSLQAPISLDTKLEPKIITELRREGLVLNDYKVLMIKKTRYIYKPEHFEECGIYNEEVVEIDLEDTATGNLYFVGYTWLKTVDGDKIEGLYFLDTTKQYGNDSVLSGMNYVYNEKFDSEKEIFIDGAKIKWIETSEYPNYRLEKVLVYTL